MRIEMNKLEWKEYSVAVEGVKLAVFEVGNGPVVILLNGMRLFKTGFRA